MTSETLVWFDAHLFKPDDSETVLIALHESYDDEPVWIGWYDSEANEWRCASSANVVSDVSYWAKMPAGPQ
jgi:hypothetical protein